MPFERPQTFFTEHGVRHSFEHRKNVTGVCSAWSQSRQFFYCDVVVNQGLLPDIYKLSGNKFTFQQDGALACRSRQTGAFLCLRVPEFVEPENWPPNSPDLNPVNYLI